MGAIYGFIASMGALYDFITTMREPFMALSLAWEPFMTLSLEWGPFMTLSLAWRPFVSLSLWWGHLWIFHCYRGQCTHFLDQGPKIPLGVPGSIFAAITRSSVKMEHKACLHSLKLLFLSNSWEIEIFY